MNDAISIEVKDAASYAPRAEASSESNPAVSTEPTGPDPGGRKLFDWKELHEELKREAGHCESWAKRNYNYAHAIFGLTVMGSFTAAILVGINTQDWSNIGLNEAQGRLLLTILTAMPAALLLVNNTLRFEERSKWFWRKCRRLQRLLRTLRDTAHPDPVVVSKEFSDISEDMEAEWPAFGSSPSQPKSAGIS